VSDQLDADRRRGDQISARTVVAGVIGDPVRHSLSPALHNAAFQALGLDWVYVAFPVAAHDAAAAVRGAVALGVQGLSVTMPHKQAAARGADQRSVAVERLGAANTIVVRSGVTVAHSTDGGGLLDDLERALDFGAAGARCAVLGAGGAARAVVLALAERGAASVVVVNRTAAAAESAALLAGRSGRVGTLADVAEADLVVNATPVELVSPSSGATAGAALGRGQIAVDMRYSPPTTRFLDEACARGATVRNGLGMLVHQAARQLVLWTGEDAPLEVLFEAARRATEGSAPVG
jgi:shikimate dehydrogenase